MGGVAAEGMAWYAKVRCHQAKSVRVSLLDVGVEWPRKTPMVVPPPLVVKPSPKAPKAWILHPVAGTQHPHCTLGAGPQAVSARTEQHGLLAAYSSVWVGHGLAGRV